MTPWLALACYGRTIKLHLFVISPVNSSCIRISDFTPTVLSYSSPIALVTRKEHKSWNNIFSELYPFSNADRLHFWGHSLSENRLSACIHCPHFLPLSTPPFFSFSQYIFFFSVFFSTIFVSGKWADEQVKWNCKNVLFLLFFFLLLWSLVWYSIAMNKETKGIYNTLLVAYMYSHSHYLLKFRTWCHAQFM